MRKLVPVLVAFLAAIALALPPALASHTPTQVLGRNAVTYNSYPFDPTPTSKWVASAQGEARDLFADNGIRDSLRGRAAVLETFGIIRARIYAVRVQAHIGGAFRTVLANEVDKVSEASRAYAVSYTPNGRFCGTDPTLVRTYRVLNSHGIRRVDGVVANRNLYSHHFVARALATDPACPETPPPPPPPPPPPTANLEIDVQGPATLQHEQTTDLDILVSNTGATAGTVTATVDFTAGLVVVGTPDSRCVLNTATTDPNDYTCNLGIFGIGEAANLDFDVEGDVVGAQAVVVTVSGTGTTDTDTDTLAISVVESADLALDKTVTSPTDRSADPGIQVRPGDTLTYTFAVNSAAASANLATNVSVVDNWPTALGAPVIVSGATGGLDTAGNLVLQFGSVAAGTTETAVVTTTVDAGVAPDSTVTNTAVVRSDQADPDTTDRADTASFVVLAPAAT